MLRRIWPSWNHEESDSDRDGATPPFPRKYDPSHEDDTDWDVEEPTGYQRVAIGAHSTTVFGYPSTGGVLVLENCNGVDLDFMHLSRFESCQSPRAGSTSTSKSTDKDVTARNQEEDEHCARMRQLGASRFQSMQDYKYAKAGMGGEDLSKRKLVVAAWPQSRPGGGVWVLAVWLDEAASKGLAAVRNAFNMDERCEVVQKLGGHFYANPKDCPDLDI